MDVPVFRIRKNGHMLKFSDSRVSCTIDVLGRLSPRRRAWDGGRNSSSLENGEVKTPWKPVIAGMPFTAGELIPHDLILVI